ncbi:energy-coupling factor ABC transporter substrate-binding protein [Desertifilum sp. FACHB-1129]|uniref:Cobalt transport protein CbiN n=1 Tax=Desertifilum tharense IPPAS B-1220 TaxID=1781255 RepID=A0A1E5QG81_9CYAN|nr:MULTISPECIES: energy-coupling factor ABC transporter substrate-binding protein [Desertifilum]MDA0209287.1 energy-coupling factor ABC transporter substrate-binding protein [Cyanobacteria bacterium FC1]MBD2315086.1 energy-coupling factor ABC transporter substrate-binding protein [Desertifilum sp. FACHB-1129]MBD2325168.1 energy-coupling factor ABC transporter substrate-binding protein [Desertifilum sp. FACHB-866]MBD2332690.1 energy-coupling factor ABC transporter substrate-binding protein [Dese
MSQKSQGWNNGLLVVAVVVLAIAPLFLVRDAEFGGADGEAEAAIQEIDPNYQPWFSPLVEPASGEIESLLFALQAGLGTGVIGYVIGLYRGKRERQVMQNPSEFKDY